MVTNEESSEDSDDSDSEPQEDSAQHAAQPQFVTAPVNSRGKQLKSGKVTTGDHYVTRQVSWPHHIIAGYPTYAELTMEQLVLGHMKIAAKQGAKVKAIMDRHLIDLMTDVTKYGFQVVKEFHSIWLQYIESDRATWEDKRTRKELRVEHVTSHNRIDKKFQPTTSPRASVTLTPTA